MEKVIAKITKVSGLVKIAVVDSDGVTLSFRYAQEGSFIYADETILSEDLNSAIEIKYLALTKTVTYEGVFSVLANSAVVGEEADNQTPVDKLEDTAAGEAVIAESSGYMEDEDVPDALNMQGENDVLEIDRGEDGEYGRGIIDIGFTPTENQNPENDQTPPVITSTNEVIFAENSTKPVHTITSTDTSAVRYYLEAGLDSSFFSVNATTGVLTFKSTPNYENPLDLGADNEYNVNVRAQDALGNFTIQAVSIYVDNINEAPVAVNDVADITENQIITLDVLNNDTDVDTFDTKSLVSVSVVGGRGEAYIEENNYLSFDPGNDFDYLSEAQTTTVTINYTMADAGGLTSDATLTLTVTGTNDAPIISDVYTDAGTHSWLLGASSTPTFEDYIEGPSLESDEFYNDRFYDVSEDQSASIEEINNLFNTGDDSVTVSDLGVNNPEDGAAVKITLLKLLFSFINFPLLHFVKFIKLIQFLYSNLTVVTVRMFHYIRKLYYPQYIVEII